MAPRSTAAGGTVIANAVNADVSERSERTTSAERTGDAGLGLRRGAVEVEQHNEPERIGPPVRSGTVLSGLLRTLRSPDKAAVTIGRLAYRLGSEAPPGAVRFRHTGGHACGRAAAMADQTRSGVAGMSR